MHARTAETRSQTTAKATDAEDTDKEFDGIELEPPVYNKDKATKGKSVNMSTKPDPKEDPKMSASAANVAANTKRTDLISDADADINLKKWSAEDVYLSRAFEKKADMGNKKIRWNAYTIVVLLHCEADKDYVTAKPIVDKETGKIYTVRIEKPKIPGVFQYSMGSVIIQCLLGGNKKAAESFGESVCEDTDGNVIRVDVHFDDPIRKTVAPTNDIHLDVEAADPGHCKCGREVKRVLEKCNAVAFEVEEVEVRETGRTKGKKQRKSVKISE